MEGSTTTRSPKADGQDAPTQVLATAVGEKCSNCGAALADDQRYCVECGQRRGKGRYGMLSSSSSSTTMTSTAPLAGGYGYSRFGWLTANSSLLLGLAVLLIAMGVGVLIGRASNSSSGKAPQQVIKVEGGSSAAPTTGGTAATGSTATTPSSTASTGSSSTSSSSKSKGTSAVTAASSLPPKAKVIPKSLASKVVKTGAKCTSGEKGCTGGKFTGSFFGGG